jgi:hypothetical protein
MAKRQRDYKAEYARRTAKAKAYGYTGYAQQRKVKEYTAEWVGNFMDRIDTSGYDWNDLDRDDPTFWIWFRVNYGKAA